MNGIRERLTRTMRIRHGSVLTKSFKLGQEATEVWRNMNEPRHQALIKLYSARARRVAKKLNIRVELVASDDRILYTAISRREAGLT